MWKRRSRRRGWLVVALLTACGAGEGLPLPAAPAAPASLSLDARWYRSGGMITGRFIPPPAQTDWPLWMQSLVGGKSGVPASELEGADLFRVPDAFLPSAARTLEANEVFTERILRQLVAIGYTAEATEWQAAKASYLAAYFKKRPLPVSDPLTTSRVLTQLAFQYQRPLLRDLLEGSRLPQGVRTSFLRMLEVHESRAKATADRVKDASRPGNERLQAFLSMRHASPKAAERLLAALKGIDEYDLAVFHALDRGWIALDSPRVSEAIRMKKVPQEVSLWFLYRPEERVSDLLWFRAMRALRGGNRSIAITHARTILARYPTSWYAGHASYLLEGLAPSPARRSEPPLRVPGDITYFNAARVLDHMGAVKRPWGEAAQEKATRHRYDVLLGEADPAKAVEPFLQAAFQAGQQDLVTRYLAVERRCTVETSPYLYPTFLKPLVERLIQEEGLEGAVDAAFVLAMIKNESIFQPAARSGAEAFGIMQLLRPTFRQMVGPSADILNPETNIRAGLRYYRTVIRSAQLESLPPVVRHLYILAGYHAGEGRARRWRNAAEAELKGRTSPREMMLRIDAIPITSTRHYILRVLGDREIYAKRLSGR